MLSIFALTGAAQAESYYEQDNYYAKDSPEAKEASNWYGKGAHELDLSGVVDKDTFKALLEGKLPTGQQLGKMEDGKIKHIPGYDLTFSAPKSVSILALVGNNKSIIQAHKNAVNTTLNYLEKQLAHTRILNDDKIERHTTGNYVIAQFHHDTSRELDPHLHTHNVILNMTQREDGKWRSIMGDVLYHYKMLGGMVYRSELATQLKQLGLELKIEHDKGLFEVKGVPEQLVEQFSTRREQIKEYLAENNLEGAKAAEVATLATRVAKSEVDREALKEGWKEQCKSQGYEVPTVDATEKTASHEQESSYKIANQGIDFALAHLSEREAVFHEKDILKTALQYGLGKTTLRETDLALKKTLLNEKAVALGDRQYTTHKAIELEKSIIHSMEQGQNSVKAIEHQCSSLLHKFFKLSALSTQTAEHYLGQQSLTHGQKEAAKLILTTNDRIVGIQGYAGTGKTFMFSKVKEYAESQDYKLIGLSPKKSAAQELQKASGIKSQTLSSFLTEKEKAINLKAVNHKEPQTLVTLDESSMASNGQLEKLFKIITKTDARLVLVGDKQQLLAVEAGKPFSILQQAGMKTAVMKDIMRQKRQELLSAVHHSIDGNIKEALKQIEGNIIETANNDERLKLIAEKYLSLSPKDRENTLVLSNTNKDCATLNELIREGLKQDKSLNGTEAKTEVLLNKGLTKAQMKHTQHYEVGDVVRFNRNYKSLNVKKGEYYKVSDVSKEALQLTGKKGKAIHWEPDKIAAGRNGAIEVYERQERSLMAGDTIRWLRNDQTLGLQNSDSAKVEQVNNNQASLRLENGKTVTLNLNEAKNQHWEHGYASTVYSAQGKTSESGLINVESDNSKLTNQRSFYVELSRAQHNVWLHTDNKVELTKTLEKYLGDKTSALEAQSYKNHLALTEPKMHDSQQCKGSELDQGLEASL